MDDDKEKDRALDERIERMFSHATWDDRSFVVPELEEDDD